MTIHRFAPTVWYNTIGSHPPALRIASGDTVVTETLDSAGVDKDGNRRASPSNPMNGPIFVEDAEPGDALRVSIDAMRPIRATGSSSIRCRSSTRTRRATTGCAG